MSENSKAPINPAVSRRGFLKGIGLGTAATGLASAVKPIAQAAGSDPEVHGPGEVPVVLKINGKNRTVAVEPRVTLLDALRNRLDLTGAKKVCDRGTCGACTVLLDGKPIYSCSMLAIEAEGHEITTIEGIGTPSRMNFVQKSFVKHDAQQCGFCTPGFVMASNAFLEKNPNPTPEEIRFAMGGNLCRCGTYSGILEVATNAMKGEA